MLQFLAAENVFILFHTWFHVKIKH